MNTIWVLMAVTTHNWTHPTLEFDAAPDCLVAVQQIKEQARERGNMFDGFCVKIELTDQQGGGEDE